MANSKSNSAPLDMWKLFRVLFGSERSNLIACVAYSTASSVFFLLLPVSVQALVNSIAFQGALQPLVILSFLVFILLALAFSLQGAQWMVVESIQQRIYVRAAHLLNIGDLKAGAALRFLELSVIQKTAAELLMDGLSIFLQISAGALLLAVYHPILLTGQLPEGLDWKALGEADPVKLAEERGLWGAPKRPEPYTLSKEVEALQEEVALSRNRILPRLDLKVNANRGLGESPASLTAQETKAAVELEVPFFFREGRGRLGASQSKLIRTEAKLRLENDRIGTEIAAVHSRFLNRREEWQLAKQEFELARQLESIERRSFAEGHSNLIDVNIREETAAAAGVRDAEAEAALATSWVDYWVSLGNWRDIPHLLP